MDLLSGNSAYNTVCYTMQLGVSGILVLDARKGGPAYKSGIKGTSRDEYGRLVIGDVITAFKGVTIKCVSVLAQHFIGSTILGGGSQTRWFWQGLTAKVNSLPVQN